MIRVALLIAGKVPSLKEIYFCEPGEFRDNPALIDRLLMRAELVELCQFLQKYIKRDYLCSSIVRNLEGVEVVPLGEIDNASGISPYSRDNIFPVFRNTRSIAKAIAEILRDKYEAIQADLIAYERQVCLLPGDWESRGHVAWEVHCGGDNRIIVNQFPIQLAEKEGE